MNLEVASLCSESLPGKLEWYFFTKPRLPKSFPRLGSTRPARSAPSGLARPTGASASSAMPNRRPRQRPLPATAAQKNCDSTLNPLHLNLAGAPRVAQTKLDPGHSSHGRACHVGALPVYLKFHQQLCVAGM